jgi:hypothetical protein
MAFLGKNTRAAETTMLMKGNVRRKYIVGQEYKFKCRSSNVNLIFVSQTISYKYRM